MKPTPEQLLQPRILSIGKYPNMTHKVGDILSGKEIDCDYLANEYPHLYRKLEWWEKRSVEDMPEYVKSIKTNKIYKIRNWSLDAKNNIYFIFEEEPNVHLGYYQHLYLPATLKDYTDYLTKTK